MAKRKYLKINPAQIFNIEPDQTLIRPKSIEVKLENRGSDFKLDFKETYHKKQPSGTQEWMIDTTISALKGVKEALDKMHKYFYYQIKPMKKGYELMIISDEAFALVAGILTELLAFGVRDKEDAFNVSPLIESILKIISKANIIDESK